MKTQRVVFLDLIRMAAILLVITQHAWSGLRLTQYGLVLWFAWLALRVYYPQFGSIHYLAFMYMGLFQCGHYCVRYLADERANRRFGLVGFQTLGWGYDFRFQ